MGSKPGKKEVRTQTWCHWFDTSCEKFKMKKSWRISQIENSYCKIPKSEEKKQRGRRYKLQEKNYPFTTAHGFHWPVPSGRRLWPGGIHRMMTPKVWPYLMTNWTTCLIRATTLCCRWIIVCSKVMCVYDLALKCPSLVEDSQTERDKDLRANS